MAYEMHISRSVGWANPEDPAAPRIAFAEWEAFVAANQELVPDEGIGAQHVTWLGPSCLEHPWLAWEEPGEISARAPDRALLGKMLEIAAYFGAQVWDDNGDFFTDASQGPPDECFAPSPPRARRKVSWWHRLIFRSSR